LSNSKKTYSDEFKFHVAVTAIASGRSLVELAAEFNIPISTISRWKIKLESEGPCLFGGNLDNPLRSLKREIKNLNEIIIGQHIFIKHLKNSFKS
jgi:transposase-like protein